jgi:hypothetical protein
VTETVVPNTLDIPATCFTEGKTQYTATFFKAGFETQSTEAPNGQPADHDWGATAYVWSADNSTCTATRVCTRNDEHKEVETVNSEFTITATCTEAGIITYTAKFNNTAFGNKEKEVDTDALGHIWVTEENTAATEEKLGVIKQKCSRCHDTAQEYNLIDNTSPSKYPDGTYISENVQQSQNSMIVQNPLGVDFSIDSLSFSVNESTPSSGFEHEETGFVYSLNDNSYSGEFSGKLRLLFYISDDWDDEDIEVFSEYNGKSYEHALFVEHRLMDAHNKFIKVVDKDYLPAQGEKVYSWVAVWSDHYGKFTIRDILTDKDAFDIYKQEAAATAAAMAAEGDSEEVQALIADAKSEIGALTYDESKTLGENKAAVDAIIAQLEEDLAAHRKVYTASFTVNGQTFYEIGFTIDTKSINEPDVPAKEGCTGKWSEYTLAASDIEIPAVYTPIEYTATFVDEKGATVKEVPFTVETGSIKDKEPAVPAKENYNGRWEDYTIAANDITIKPVYTLAGETAVDCINYGDSAKLGYKQTQQYTFIAEYLPEGASVHVFVNGEDQGEGTSVKVKEPTESYTVQAKVLDENGNVIAESSVINVKVKNTLCARIWYFFMKLLTSLAHAIGKTAKGN